MPMNNLPLKGISGVGIQPVFIWAFGWFATGRLGARVIKIERPGTVMPQEDLRSKICG